MRREENTVHVATPMRTTTDEVSRMSEVTVDASSATFSGTYAEAFVPSCTTAAETWSSMFCDIEDAILVVECKHEGSSQMNGRMRERVRAGTCSSGRSAYTIQRS